jgi:uncharacterized protein with GYD domain
MRARGNIDPTICKPFTRFEAWAACIFNGNAKISVDYRFGSEQFFDGGSKMATFVMFGNYSNESIGDISPKRTKKAEALIRNNGGEVVAGYALLGKTDLVLIVDLPDIGKAMQTSVGLSKMLGISFTTAPAVSLKKFDKLMEV